MSITIDPRSLVIRESPPEWPAIPGELVERLAPTPPQPIRDQFGKWHYFSQFPMFTPEQKAQLDRIAAGRWFLIRANDRVRCTLCGGKHPYFTRGCVEKPYNGLTEITTALLTVRSASGRVRETEYSAVKLGDIEPIAEIKARRLREAIIMRGYIP